MNGRGRWTARLLPAVAAVVLGVAPADAQPLDDGLRADSRGIAADAEPLQADSADTACDPWGRRVVRDGADAHALERFPRCGPGAFPALGSRLYAHVPLMGDCHATHEVQAYRSAARREYRIVVTSWYGGCRAGRFDSRWVALPPLPDGWTLAFTEVRVDHRRQAWRADTLGAAADGVPLRMDPAGMHCRPTGFHAVRDDADARELARLPGCEPAQFSARGRHLYVHVPADGCGGRYAVRAYRSHARREFRVVRVARSRGCGARGDPGWFRLPPLPDGWTVAFTEAAA
jgi:hypothetical protein